MATHLPKLLEETYRLQSELTALDADEELLLKMFANLLETHYQTLGTARRHAGRLLMSLKTSLATLLLASALYAQQKPLRERLLESAQKGDAEAQFELGKNYETGRIGLPKDLAQAEHWYRLAAVQGDPFAEASLGILYQFGKGLPKDSVQALMWYEVAIARAAAGDRDSIVELRDDVITGMTPVQIAEARRLARAFKPAQ